MGKEHKQDGVSTKQHKDISFPADPKQIEEKEPRHEKTGLCHTRSLISAFVVRCLDSIIPLVSISEISSLYLASVAKQAGLRLPLS